MNQFTYTSAEQFCDVQDTAGREFLLLAEAA
jgi:hypothetical protein